MEIGEATQLFSQLCDDFHAVHDAKTVPKLLQELDFLPLAISVAAGYMHRTKTSPSEYLKIFLSYILTG